MENLLSIINFYNNFFIFFTLINNLFYLFLIILAFKNLNNFSKERLYNNDYSYLLSEHTPSVSILVPCYNEEKTILSSITSLLSLEYNNYEIIVINDGSKDSTLLKIVNHFQLKKLPSLNLGNIPTQTINAYYISREYPNLILIDKHNGGKADSLNAGINASTKDLFITLDADSIMEKSSLLKVVIPFIDDNSHIIAASGIVMINNGCTIDKGYLERVNLPKNFIAKFQTIEYLRAFICGRMGWSYINALLITSGAFSIFERKLVNEVGGFTPDTVGEDMDIIMKLHQYLRKKKFNYSIKFIPDPICWTQCPESLESLYSQRKRWQHGLMDCMIQNKNMLFNKNFGVIGLLSVPYYWIFEVFEPFITVSGFAVMIMSVFLNLADIKFIILLYSTVFFFGILVSITAVLLGEYTLKRYEKISDYFKLLFYAVIENFGYRQISTFFRVISVFEYKYKNNSWGKIKRKEVS